MEAVYQNGIQFSSESAGFLEKSKCIHIFQLYFSAEWLYNHCDIQKRTAFCRAEIPIVNTKYYICGLDSLKVNFINQKIIN